MQILKKLKSELNTPIDYYLNLGEKSIHLNAYLGKSISFIHTGNIFCIQCERKTAKSFQQGYCFSCLRRLQECNLCVIHPERCLVEKKPCPENDWAHTQCNKGHVIYLANASGLKVGITRDTQIPTRWIDQGAVQAIPIFTTKNRYQAGVVEVALKEWVADRTNWRAMLKNQVVLLDLVIERNKLLQQADIKISQLIAQSASNSIEKILEDKSIELNYPVLEYPSQVKSLSLDETKEITGQLLGIKGQYLIFDRGVLNIRKFGGYEVDVKLA